MHLYELNSPGSDALLNFFSVFHQVRSTPYSQFLHFTWFSRLIAPKQHCFIQTIHVSLMFFYNHVPCLAVRWVICSHTILSLDSPSQLTQLQLFCNSLLTCSGSATYILSSFSRISYCLSCSFENTPLLSLSLDPNRVIRMWSGSHQT